MTIGPKFKSHNKKEHFIKPQQKSETEHFYVLHKFI